MRQDEEAELEEQERRDVSIFFGACLPGTDALDRNGWQGLIERPRGDGAGEGEVVVGGKADGAGVDLVRACTGARHGEQIVVRRGKGGVGGGGGGGDGAHVLGGKLEKEWDVLERWERRRQWLRHRDRAERRDAGRAAEKKRERGGEEFTGGGGGGGRVLDEERVYRAVCVDDWVSRRFCCGGSVAWCGWVVVCAVPALNLCVCVTGRSSNVGPNIGSGHSGRPKCINQGRHQRDEGQSKRKTGGGNRGQSVSVGLSPSGCGAVGPGQRGRGDCEPAVLYAGSGSWQRE